MSLTITDDSVHKVECGTEDVETLKYGKRKVWPGTSPLIDYGIVLNAEQDRNITLAVRFGWDYIEYRYPKWDPIWYTDFVFGARNFEFGGWKGPLELRHTYLTPMTYEGNVKTEGPYGFHLMSDDPAPFTVEGNLGAFIDYWDTSNPLARFENIFKDCRGLVDASRLILPRNISENTTFEGMFDGCVDLVYPPPSVRPFVMNEEMCKNMFRFCSSLVETPILPATDLSDGCYLSMFEGCSSLKEMPELPALGLPFGCYMGMFTACTSLTEAYLPAVTIRNASYRLMFFNCTNLKLVRTAATVVSAATWQQSMYGWLYGTSTEGQLYHRPTCTIASSTNEYDPVPPGWTPIVY